MHAPFTHYSGTIGKLVYRKYRGRTIVSVKPDPDRPLSQAQTAQRQDFTQAATWAKAAMQDEKLRLFYEALGKKRDIPARAAAVSDFLKRPTLGALDLSEYAGQAGEQYTGATAAQQGVSLVGDHVLSIACSCVTSTTLVLRRFLTGFSLCSSGTIGELGRPPIA